MSDAWNDNRSPSNRYSQHEEGGFITALCHTVGLLPGVHCAVDVGAGDGYKLSNVRHLQELFGWELCLFDYMDAPGVHKEFITRDNIVDILDKHHVPDKIAVMSLDLDGNDYWVWKSFFENQDRRPEIIVTEYNINLPPQPATTIVYNEGHIFGNNDYYGASLEAFVRLFDKYGYKPCGHIIDNVFFVKKNVDTSKVPATKQVAPVRVWGVSGRSDWVINPPY